MACTNYSEYADRMRIMSLHGISRDAWKRDTGEGTWYYEIIAPGFKYNLSDIAAAIGLHQVRKADAFHARRSELALLYTRWLREVEEVILPRVQPDRVHSWHLYSIRLRVDRLRIDQAQFIAELKERGIGLQYIGCRCTCILIIGKLTATVPAISPPLPRFTRSLSLCRSLRP
jgi:perosamine synthetase